MSGLDELTREELQALVVKLYETVRLQQAEIAKLKATVESQADRIRELEEEVARLRGGWSSAQLCVRPSVPKKEKAPRKKRKHCFARTTLPATQVVLRAVDQRPDCGRNLVGGHEKWRHQVIELPQIRVKVTDHVFVERRCGVCRKKFTPDPSVVLGKEFDGALVADFYGAYNFYEGIKQRFWVHLARDLRALVEKNPDLPKLAQ
ncbi:MAG: hypothetical protein A2Z18_05940 [Armatimonadetes bacterium RBG_16_58_9]|nr:MAG: hypothetical protein A2Z18_05940 [Armatimonadetes bacterium RBG_16_58_9]